MRRDAPCDARKPNARSAPLGPRASRAHFISNWQLGGSCGRDARGPRLFSEQARRRPGAEGFTLVEMMVAVTLVALMSLALWGVLRISISSWKRGTDFIDANQRQRTTLDLVQKQMASIYPLVPPLDLQMSTGITPIFSGSASSMQFISLCALRFRDNPGLTMVCYEAVAGSDGDFSLVARETRYLGGDPSLQADYEQTEVPAMTIFDRLDSLEFEYYDPGTPDLPPQWVKEWSAKDLGRLPTWISMTLVSRDAGGTQQARRIIIPIPAQLDNPQANFMDPFNDPRRRVREDDPRTRR